MKKRIALVLIAVLAIGLVPAVAGAQTAEEAAAIDGARFWTRFRTIVFPLLSPTTFFVTVMAIISGFQVFRFSNKGISNFAQTCPRVNTFSLPSSSSTWT